MYFYRLIQSNKLSEKMKEDPNTFHNFQSAAMWDEVFIILVKYIQE